MLPVFIGGFRSGTTLLANLLGLHPELAAWFETKELCEALRWQRVTAAPDQAMLEQTYCRPAEPAGFTLDAVAARMMAQMRDTHARIDGRLHSGKAAHERYPLGNDCVAYPEANSLAALAGWRAALADTTGDAVQLAAANGRLITTLGEQQRRLLSKPFWVNKTPEISRFASQLRAALGPCRIIYLVRDGRAVVASGKGLQWGDAATLAWHWKGLLESTRAAMATEPAHYLELRYEQLVLDPIAVLDRVLVFCGLAPRGTALVQQFRAGFGDTAFDTTRLASAAALSAEDAQVFEAVAGSLQAALGY